MSSLSLISSSTKRKVSRSHRRSNKRQKTTNESGDSVFGPAQEVMDVAFPLQRSMATTYTTVQAYEVNSFLTTSTTVPVYVGAYFTLSSLANSASFAACFDQYRIDMVEVTAYSDSLSTQSGLVTTCIDYDGIPGSLTVAQALSYNTAQTKAGGAAFRRTFVPGVALAAYSGSFGSYANKKKQWIDTVSTGVQHYGFLMASSITEAVIHYSAVTRMVISFRNNV